MKILVVDDERITLRNLERRLKGWGHDVVGAADGAAAWEQFEKQRFDIVVTDWDMPRMDGRELIRRIRGSERSSYTYLIMLTGRSETDDLVAGMEAGADDFLAKPFDRHELRVRLIAGERIIALERELGERNQALSAANEQLEGTIRELQETQAALVQSEKMASLANVVAGIAHEINNPVGAINSNSETIVSAVLKLRAELERVSPESKNDRALNRILDVLEAAGRTSCTASGRVVRIVQSLRNFARLDEAARLRADLHDGLESTLTLLHHRLEGRIEVVRDYGDLPEVVCLASQLNQVFMNLLVNAAEAIESEGVITVRTRTDGSNVSLAFTDTGVGIPEEIEAKVFDPGFTTKGVGVGAGLGLASCYTIVREHGGGIEVESEVGRGTTFTVTLPLTMGE